MNTPDQARELWCPMARIARHETTTVEGDSVGNLTPVREEHHIVAGCNRDAMGSKAGFVLNSCKCIAEKCAMWRWVPSTTMRKERRAETYQVNIYGKGCETRHREIEIGVPDAPSQGYCGIGGRPEAMP